MQPRSTISAPHTQVPLIARLVRTVSMPVAADAPIPEPPATGNGAVSANAQAVAPPPEKVLEV